MSMSRKHFDAFADKIHRQVTVARKDRKEAISAGDQERENANTSFISGLNMAVIAFADVASDDNPRFDKERFMTACGFAASGRRVNNQRMSML